MKTRFLIVALAFTSLFAFTQCSPSEAKLKVMVKAMNLTLPTDLGNGVTYEKVEVKSASEIYCTFTSRDMDKESMTEEVKETMTAEMTQSMKTNSDFDEFRKMEIDVTYIYLDKAGEEVVRITIPHADYN